MVFKKIIALTVIVTFFWGMKVAAQCGSVNTALNRPATASGSAYGTSPSGAVNGLVNNTGWSPVSNMTSWMYVDLESVQTVCKIIVKWGRYNAAPNFKIQMTNTPATSSSWLDISEANNITPTDGIVTGDYYSQFVYHELTITSTNNTGRYVRLLMENIPSSANYYVHELEVYKTSTNSNPGISLINPVSAISLAVNTAFQLSANASDPDGTISEVAFYNGTTLLGISQQTTQPYTYTWTPTTAGTYNIKAEAKDNIGAIGSSLTFTVTVTPPNTGWGLLGNELVNNTTAFLGSTDAHPFVVKTNNIERYRVTPNGQMLIGSTLLAPSSPANTKLTVNGFIMSKGVKVTQQSANWPDYVFEKNYKLLPLASLEEFIKKNKHLPAVPSAKEIKSDGIDLGEMQALLLKKIEELTLYLLEQNKKIESLEIRNKELQEQIKIIKQGK